MDIVIIGKSPIYNLGFTNVLREKAKRIVIENPGDRSQAVKSRDVSTETIVIVCLSQMDAPDENLSELKAASRKYPKSRIVVFEIVSQRNPCQNLRAYLNYGVSGFLTTLDSLEVINDCFESIGQDRRYICPQAVDWLMNDFAAERESRPLLTKTEFYIARELSEGLSVSEIARKTNRKSSTISTIKKNIFRKMNTDNIVKLREKVLNSELRDFSQVVR
ncbi:hypothetical protein GCM10023091_40430 [Ravibacter arvi]|uniref:HTH luxR-type domain-containing protein n=1 Tax=Ravibacter arvi TaxID=2051041 RepID=A0ABP8M956_9BACT